MHKTLTPITTLTPLTTEKQKPPHGFCSHLHDNYKSAGTLPNVVIMRFASALTCTTIANQPEQ